MRGRGHIARIAVFTVAWAAPATSFTGAELLELCSQSGVSDHLACSSYVRGLADGLSYASILAGGASKYCPPVSVQVKEIRAIVEKYLREHRDQRTNEAGALAGAALYRAFPCNRSR
jgi:Rap1a immunity proteins